MLNPNLKYPHLLPADIEVWERFLDAHPLKFASIEYDVRVGEGRDPGITYPDNMRQMALDLSRRRIDAVGHALDSITIIEITTIAGLKAVGQLTTYPDLYRQTFSPTLPIKSLLVASSIETDILDTIIRNGIDYALFPD